MIVLNLPYPPSVNNLFPTGKSGRRFKSDEYSAWLEHAATCVSWKAKKVITGPYTMTATFDRPDRRARDLGNLEKAVSDLLVSLNVVKDDRHAQRITLQWGSADPVKPARVVVTLEAL